MERKLVGLWKVDMSRTPRPTLTHEELNGMRRLRIEICADGTCYELGEGPTTQLKWRLQRNRVTFSLPSGGEPETFTLEGDGRTMADPALAYSSKVRTTYVKIGSTPKHWTVGGGQIGVGKLSELQKGLGVGQSVARPHQPFNDGWSCWKVRGRDECIFAYWDPSIPVMSRTIRRIMLERGAGRFHASVSSSNLGFWGLYPNGRVSSDFDGPTADPWKAESRSRRAPDLAGPRARDFRGVLGESSDISGHRFEVPD